MDPIAISKVYYERDKELREWTMKTDIYKWLRNKNRLYEDRLNHLRKYKVSFQNKLSICFPGFLKLFKDGYSDIPMVILKKYPHPDLLKNKTPETVAKYIEKNTCHKHKAALRYAKKVIEFANKTYPGCEKDDVEVEDLKLLLDKVIETNHVLLNRLDLLNVQSFDGTHGATILLFYAYDDVASSDVVEVICECTDGTVDGIRIPSLLILYPGGFHNTASQKLFNADW